MAVAKRQRREKPPKIEQRKVWGPEWGPEIKQTALLASPLYTGQVHQVEKKIYIYIKRGAKIEPGATLLFVSFGSSCPHTLRMYIPLFSKQNWAVTQSCNTVHPRALTLVRPLLQNFVTMRWNLGIYPLPWNTEYKNYSFKNNQRKKKLWLHTRKSQ